MLNEADWSPYLGPQSIGPLLIDFQIHRGPGELSVVLGVSSSISVRSRVCVAEKSRHTPGYHTGESGKALGRELATTPSRMRLRHAPSFIADR